MNPLYEQRLRSVADNGGGALISGGSRGIEKECLRITPEGLISQASHPAGLGSALSNSYITTDYSEALLEFVTPPEPSAWAAMQFLCDIHQFTYSQIGDELLWPFSMPCRLRSEADIPVARYGSSNVGRMKTIYRNGLGHRYGRYMQAIAGIHFNYSVPDAYWELQADSEAAAGEIVECRSAGYLGLVRNVRRMDWLLLYLFGASPAVCKSFLAGVDSDLEQLDSGTCFGRWATSLRMSDLGYQNSSQSAVVVSANSLDEYINDLATAIVTPNPDYVALGVRQGDDYLQLNANQLQIENEYYSSVRPKRVALSGERPTAALGRGGVEYVELRSLDLSPFDPAGLGQTEQKFLEAFLLYCLFTDSPPISADEQAGLQANNLAVARAGRKPGLELRRAGESAVLQDWAREICTAMRPVCELLDRDADGGYGAALDQQLAVVEDPDLTPSARLLEEVRTAAAPFAEYGLDVARGYREYFEALPADFNAHQALLLQESANSLQKQLATEAGDEMSLDDYIARYYA
jgi:glutamate--cysteine ligase